MRGRTQHPAVAALATIGILFAAPVRAEPLALQPSSAWNADFAAESCILRREFARGAVNAVLEIVQYVPGSSVQIRIASPEIDWRFRSLRAGFLPDEYLSAVNFVMRTSGDEGWRGIRFSGDLVPDRAHGNTAAEAIELGTPNDDEARDIREAEITAFALRGIRGDGIDLATGELHAPMEVMRQCMDDLLREWGLDPATQRELSRKVTELESQPWHYGISGRQRQFSDRHGIDQFTLRLVVAPDGTASACRVIEVSGPDGQDNSVCTFALENARFHPALDAEGVPAASVHSVTFARIRM